MEYIYDVDKMLMSDILVSLFMGRSTKHWFVFNFMKGSANRNIYFLKGAHEVKLLGLVLDYYR